MRKITRLEISETVKEQIKKKQNKIDSGLQNQTWWNLSNGQRKIIIKKLILSQKYICCYCECEINEKNNHIEHFLERHDFPDKVYDYNNMLLSCQGNTENKKVTKENTTCGHKKSNSYHNKIEIDYNLLLNPTDEKTSNLFLYRDDGIIEPAKECGKIEKQKVKYTENRLGLNSIRLKNQRLKHIEIIQNNLENEEMTSEEVEKYINSLLDLSKDKIIPYYSTIKDNFEYLIK